MVLFLATVGAAMMFINPNAKQIPPKLQDRTAAGKIVAISKTSITISDCIKPTLITTLPFDDALAKGEVAESAYDHNGYRVRDVEIGDIVNVTIVLYRKVAFCETIWICERPGGLIPESQKPWGLHPYHERHNAMIANRDHGVPLPSYFEIKLLPSIASDK